LRFLALRADLGTLSGIELSAVFRKAENGRRGDRSAEKSA
jgi:hypothetical protein